MEEIFSQLEAETADAEWAQQTLKVHIRCGIIVIVVIYGLCICIGVCGAWRYDCLHLSALPPTTTGLAVLVTAILPISYTLSLHSPIHPPFYSLDSAQDVPHEPEADAGTAAPRSGAGPQGLSPNGESDVDVLYEYTNT